MILEEEISTVILAIVCSNLLFFTQKHWLMNPVYIAVTAGVFYAGIRYAWRMKAHFYKTRIWQGCICLGILFSLMVVVGAKIEAGNLEFGTFTMGDFFCFFFYAVLGVFLFFNLYLVSENKKISEWIHPVSAAPVNAEKGREKNWAVYSMILVLAWVPVWIIYFPGIMPEDAAVSVAMGMRQLPLDNHFPVFYTLIVRVFIAIGERLHNVNLGIALYSVTQLTIMAGGIGFFLSWLQKKGINKKYIYFGLAYFAGGPMFGNYAIVMWKDPWFSGLLILVAIFLYEYVVVDRQLFLDSKALFCYCALIVLMSLMRNNGIYIAVLINICLLIVYRKQIRRVLLPLIGSILLIWLTTGPGYRYLFSAENVFVEAVGIPIQQMARCVVEDGELGSEDTAFLDELLPMEKYADYYDPFLVDPIKWAPEFNTAFLDSHKKEFFRTWWSMLQKNLGTYVEQYLMGTYGYWHIGGDTNYEFVKTEITGNDWGMYQSSPFEKFLAYPMKEKLNGKYDYIATGLLIWIMLFDMVLCWMKKQSIYMFPLLVMAGNWLTLMVATPTAFGIRYMYVSVIGFPLLLIYPWLISRKQNGDAG